MFRINTQAFAQQEDQSQKACTTSQDKSNKGPADWLSGIWKPIIKYTPADIVIPYTLLPDTLDSWKKFKKNMEDKYLTDAFMINPYFPDLAYRMGLNGLRVKVPEPQLIKPPPRIEYDLSEM